MVVRRSALQRSGDKNVSQTPLKPICVQYGFRFFGYEKSKSVLHADGLKKSLRRIFIAPALECGRANHHPCPLLKGGGLGGG